MPQNRKKQIISRPLWFRVAVPTVISLLLFCYALFFIHFPSIKTSLMDHKRAAVKNLVQAAWSILEEQYLLEKKGQLSRDEAQRQALGIISSLRYGNENKDYFWINDQNGIMLSHPYRPDLVGSNVLHMQDSRGKQFILEFVQTVKKKGAGFVEYMWQWKDDPARVVPKISYVKGFRPWGWIIGSGLYVDDVEAQAQKQVEEFGAVIGFVLSIGFLLAMISVWQGKRADRTLAASREKFQAIFNQTFQFIVILSPSGIIQEINKTAFEFYGGIEEDLVGKRLFETTWWSTIPEMRKRLSEAVNKATSGQMDRFEYKRSDSHEDMRVMDVSVKPVHDYESGEIEYLVVEGRDITDKWNAEQELRWLNEELEMRVQARTMALEKSLSSLKETQDQLVESEKMASLGGLVAGVAHEINTPLGIGVTTTSYLDQKIDEMLEKYENETITRADFEKFLHVSKESATSSLLNLTRASELIHSFKQVAADQSSESRREFELKSYLDEILLSLHSMYKKSGHEVTIYGEEIELKSYPGAIMQIMTNLLNNALQHGFEKKKNGKIMITTSRRDGMAVIKFADDGAGMNEYVLKRIYEPFFTTKRSQGGAGLGMHVVYNLVNRTLGGTIQCSSTQGQGTVFNISIPVDAPRNDT